MKEKIYEVLLVIWLVSSTVFAFNANWNKAIYGVCWVILIQLWIFREEKEKEGD
ncbi:hypothetical protein [Clostridium kluyveri]|uniref:hypothetical protein n=1 Tax=Clostridium kluyveri TaxID=1534 RepID=UPI0012EB9FB8|nr:hypothetical protein [Clostridium kluyveri]